MFAFAAPFDWRSPTRVYIGQTYTFGAWRVSIDSVSEAEANFKTYSDPGKQTLSVFDVMGGTFIDYLPYVECCSSGAEENMESSTDTATHGYYIGLHVRNAVQVGSDQVCKRGCVVKMQKKPSYRARHH